MSQARPPLPLAGVSFPLICSCASRKRQIVASLPTVPAAPPALSPAPAGGCPAGGWGARRRTRENRARHPPPAALASHSLQFVHTWVSEP